MPSLTPSPDPAVLPSPPARLASTLGASLLWALAIVAVGVALIAADPLLITGFHRLVPDTPVLRAIAEALTRALDIPTVAASGLLYVALCPHLRLRRLGVFAAVTLTQGFLNSRLKELFGRSRPDAVTHAGEFLGPLWGASGLSFPGGHAAAAFALAVLFSTWHPRLKPVFYALATAVAVARIYLHRHYFADTYFGAWIGAMVAASLIQWLWRPQPPVNGTPPPHQA